MLGTENNWLYNNDKEKRQKIGIDLSETAVIIISLPLQLYYCSSSYYNPKNNKTYYTRFPQTTRTKSDNTNVFFESNKKKILTEA